MKNYLKNYVGSFLLGVGRKCGARLMLFQWRVVIVLLLLPGCPRGRRATWVIMGLPKVCVVEGGVVKSGLKRIEREREREIKT